MGEVIVEDGHYGEDFIILLAGEATVYKYPDEVTRRLARDAFGKPANASH